MAAHTHVYSTNWASHTTLDDSVRPYRDQLGRLLGLLDGGDRWCLGLWRLPLGVDFWDVDHSQWPKTFLQAGGAAGRMMLEVRYIEDDGKERQYVVGRPGGDYRGEPSEVVTWETGAEFRVYPNEVFTADEATDAFYGYFQTDRVPDAYPLRWLDFSAYE